MNHIPDAQLTHVGLFVHDLESMAGFYASVFGMVRTDEGSNYRGDRVVFLSRNPNEHHQLVLATGRADLKDTNRYGGTALIPAAHHGHPDTVTLLLKTEIDVDHVNRLGWTALLETIILSDGGPVHQNILAQLIAAGADVNLADGEGVSPLAHARSRGYSAMIAMLEKAGAR